MKPYSRAFLLLLILPAAALRAYDPPIGIPDPETEFGWEIDRPTPDWPTEWTDPVKTTKTNYYFINKITGDNTNGNGHPGAPRKTIPEGELAPGSFLYIEAGTFTASDTGRYDWHGAGTLAEPIWITGNRTTPPVFQTALQIGENGSASYIILENIEISGSAGASLRIVPRPQTASDLHSFDIDHILIRNVRRIGTLNNSDTNGITVGISQSTDNLPDTTISDIVIYDCDIYDVGATQDDHGVEVGYHTNRVWVLDNDIHNVGGDSVQGSHYSTYGPHGAAISVSGADSGDVFTATSHNLSNGDRVTLLTASGMAGVSADTEYYAIRLTSNTFQLAATLTDAIASTKVPLVLTSDGTGTISHPDKVTENLYIGRNLMYGNGENGVDIKTVIGFTISQNTIYGPFEREQGYGIVAHSGFATGYHPRNGAILFNSIHTCSGGVYTGFSSGTDNLYIIGNKMWDIKASHAFQADTLNGACVQIGGTTIGANSKFYIVDNTFHDYDRGVYLEPEVGDVVSIHGNIFSERTGISASHYDYELLDSIPLANQADVTLNYNLYKGTPTFRWRAIDGLQTRTIDYMRTTAFQEANGIVTSSAVFVNQPGNYPVTADLSLVSGSPAIDVGLTTTVGHAAYAEVEATFGQAIKVDYQGTARPIDGIWDIGALESALPPNAAPSGLQVTP